MAQEPIDYEMVLADLEAKRSALETAIAALRQVLSTGAQVTLAGAQTTLKAIDPASIPDDAFFGLSISDAAKKYLGMVKRKQSVKDIADALDRGGLPHTSSNFMNTVGTMLSRAAVTDPELVRVGRGEWGLAGWYGNRRPKPEPVKKPKRSKREHKGATGQRTAQKSKSDADDGAAKQAQQSPAKPPATEGVSVRQLAEQTLQDAGGPLHVNEILKRIEATTGRKVNKDTLAALFSVTVRKSDTFYKAAPGVFGMIDQRAIQQATTH